MRSRAVAVPTVLALALALAGSAGCANMTRNQQQGLAVVGGMAVVVGSTVLIDGFSCDEANWHAGGCEHDTGELRNGAIAVGLGGALLTWALLQLDGDAPAPSGESTRTAAAKRK